MTNLSRTRQRHARAAPLQGTQALSLASRCHHDSPLAAEMAAAEYTAVQDAPCRWKNSTAY
jgi:hypothetical protein